MLKIRKGTVRYVLDGTEREITVDRHFWLADREVSVHEFEQFVNDKQYPRAGRPTGWNRDERYDQIQTDDQPVSNVIWSDAVLFCNWLSEKEGRKQCYRPTGAKAKIETQYGQKEFETWH